MKIKIKMKMKMKVIEDTIWIVFINELRVITNTIMLVNGKRGYFMGEGN